MMVKQRGLILKGLSERQDYVFLLKSKKRRERDREKELLKIWKGSRKRDDTNRFTLALKKDHGSKVKNRMK